MCQGDDLNFASVDLGVVLLSLSLRISAVGEIIFVSVHSYLGDTPV